MHNEPDEEQPARPAIAPARVRIERPEPAGMAPLEMGDDETTRQALQLTTRYVTRDGQPWIPVMGEYHFVRDLPHRWERELRKMKAGGINVLATYVLWISHEESRGQVRWDGNRDLRAFIEVADRVGLKVLLRIGPWAHGETRNGGFPDWLQQLPIRLRSNDPRYLELTRGWYASIAERVEGLIHGPANPDGPIIGIQVDNELYDDGLHLAALRDLAESVGMSASLWTATGWGGADIPTGRLLPVYAGYSDGFWEESDQGWPEFGVMHFTFSTVRDDLTVGADLRESPVDVTEHATLGQNDPWPFVTCELGGGMAVAYHRRPLVDPDDVAALALTKLGSGSAWQGYYMYHGGQHVLGELSSTQESHDTGYPNDVPVRDYDFFAPLGAVGTQRPHFHKLRQQHLMLESFASTLATAATTIPAEDGSGLRWAVRSDGDRGYLFVNNHQPAVAALPPIDDVQFEVELGEQTVTVPRDRLCLDSGSFFVWPLRQRFGDIPHLTVTAQPITQLTANGRTVVLFAAQAGVPVQLQFEGVSPRDVVGAAVREDGPLVISAPAEEPGIGCEVQVAGTTLVFLDQSTGESVWRGDVGGHEAIVLWDGSGWFNDGFQVEVPVEDARLHVFPPLRSASSARPAPGTVFTAYDVAGADVEHALVAPAFDSAPVAPVRLGGPAARFSAPTDEDFAGAATVELDIPGHVLADAHEAVLTLRWTGDVVRVYVGDEFIGDQFWSGRPLELGLAPHRQALLTQPLTLKAFAWSTSSGVYLDPRVRPAATEPVLSIESVTVHVSRVVTLS